MGYAQLVIGPAGSGKSTYCSTLLRFCESMGRTVHVVNLDPAAEHLPYPAAIDIRDVVTSNDAMADLGLGPNASLVHCMSQMDSWLYQELANFREDDYLIFDFPGQIELFTHLPNLQNLIKRLDELNFNLCSVYLLDSLFMSDASNFIGGCTSCLTSMLHLSVPQVNVMSKMENVKNKKEVKLYLNPNRRFLTKKIELGMYPAEFKEMNKALIKCVKECEIVNFIPLELNKVSSIRNVLTMTDICVQYGMD